jgi:hypothetical protein
VCDWRIEHDQVTGSLDCRHLRIKNGAPVARPVEHGCLAETIDVKREDDPAPDAERAGGFKDQEIGAARRRTDDGRDPDGGKRLGNRAPDAFDIAQGESFRL